MISSISAHPGAAWSFSKALLKAACSGSGACFCPGEQRASIQVLILPYTFVPLTSCVSIYQTSYFAQAHISGIACGHIQGMLSDW